MAQSVGRLTALLGLDASEYVRGLTKAEADAKRFAANTRSAILEVGKVIAGLEIGRQVFNATKEIIGEAAALNDLSDATGSSVESLSRLTNQSKIAGADFAQVEAAVLKLSSGMAGLDSDSKRVKETLKILGITTKDPVQALQEAAIKLSSYADGVNKVGLAAALFGERQGPKFLATLKDIAELQDVGATVSAKQAAEAEALEKAFRRLSVEASAFRTVILSDVVPALLNMIDDMREGTRIAGGFWEALRLFGTLSPFDTPGESIKKLRTEMEALQRTQTKGRMFDWFNEIPGELADKAKQIEFQKNKIQQLARSLIDPSNNDVRDILAQRKPPAPNPPPKGGAGSTSQDKAAQIARRLLDQQIKDLDDFIRSEQDALNDRQRFLQLYYQDDQLGLRDFFEGRRNALEEALEKEGGALDKQAALLRKRIAELDEQIPRKKTVAEKDTATLARIDAETKLQDVIAKRARLEQDVTTKGIELFIDEGRAVKGFRESIEQASIALAEMRGDTVTAAAASFDFANRRITQQLANLRQSANPDDQRLAVIGERDLSDTRALIVLRAQLNKATEDYALTLDELGIAQARIQIAEETGAASSLQAFDARQALAAKYVAILKEELVTLEAIAQESGKREDFVKVQRLRLQMEQLAAGALIEEQKALKDLANAVTESFASAFEGFINGTKSAKDAFRSFVDDVSAMLTKLALKKVGDALFGSSTAGGPDFFSLLAKFVGGFGGFGGFSGGGGSFGGAGGGGSFATGGVTRGGPALVGERGPEVVDLPALARSNIESRGFLQQFNVPAGVEFGGGARGSFATNSSEALPIGSPSTVGGVSRGDIALVGKRGPEIVDLPAGARVHSNAESRDYLRKFNVPGVGLGRGGFGGSFAGGGSSFGRVGAPSSFATGGVSRGGRAIVGENGPELVDLPSVARVRSNSHDFLRKFNWRSLSSGGVGPALVGERGPELVDSPAGTLVRQRNESSDFFGRFGGSGFREHLASVGVSPGALALVEKGPEVVKLPDRTPVHSSIESRDFLGRFNLGSLFRGFSGGGVSFGGAGGIGSFATGGVSRGGLALVGERGPELVDLPARAHTSRESLDLLDKFKWPGLRDRFATGGVSRGGLALVGEQGPEVVDLPPGSRIRSNSESRNVGGNVINITQVIDRNTNTRAHRQAALDAFNSAAGAARRR